MEPMPKEIRFRAWDVNQQVMYEPFHPLILIYFYDEGFPLNDEFPEFPTPENFILMQFTGRKDKNGQEIYEEDIVKFVIKNSEKKISGAGVVKWSDELLAWIVEVLFLETHLGFITEGIPNYFMLSEITELRIAGNTYETPDLLDINCW